MWFCPHHYGIALYLKWKLFCRLCFFFDYASFKPCKSNCNWQGQTLQIPSMIKKRMGFESKRNFENNNRRKESWTCVFFFFLDASNFWTILVKPNKNSHWCNMWMNELTYSFVVSWISLNILNKCDSQLYFFLVFLLKSTYLFIYFWLRWVLVSAYRPFIAAWGLLSSCSTPA